MPYTPEQKAAFDMACYGMPESAVDAYLKPQAEFTGRDMLIMSMLSDVQEMLERGMKEEARMTINKVKHVLSEFPLNKEDEFLANRRKG